MNRKEIHARAEAAWAETRRQCRVAGLAERLRREKGPKKINRQKQAQERLRFRGAQLKPAKPQAIREPTRYARQTGGHMPHQGKRECARRRQQMARMGGK